MGIRGDAATSAGRPARFDSRPWRDPRFLLGLLLVVAATVLGGWAVAAADRTVSYWATAGAVRLGEQVSRDDFVAVRAKVPRRTARLLLPTDAELPDRLSRLNWAASVQAGTLITGDLLVSRAGLIELPLVVANGNAPADLRAGDRVDVWAPAAGKSSDTTAVPTSAQRLLSRVRVVSRSSAASVGGGSGSTVVVDVAGLTVSGRLVGAASSGRVTIVRVP